MKSKDSLNSVFELKTEMNLQFRRVMASIVLILVSLCSINVLLTIVVTSEKVCLGHRKIPYTQLSWTTFSKCKLPPAERTIYQYSSDSPIHLDAVITYVNGADPKFENMKKKYQSKGKLVRYSNTPNRFADNFDLKFLLRSLDKYGQLFRFVFLVVAFESQIPKWLNLKHAKLKIVMHSDIWYNLTHLPTFNSLAIEANLHHIQNVSNIFVYFNDDLLLTQPAELSDFVSVSEGFRVDSIVVRPYMSLEKYDKLASSCFKFEIY